MKKFLALFLLVVGLSVGPVCTPARSTLDSPTQNGDRVGDTGNPSVRVWVNTSTHVYHCPGTRYYGATKRGEYMTQKQAQDAGSRPAYGRFCR
jgi:hypothetical protein